MKQIVYVVVKETPIPDDVPLVGIDSVWDVFEHADDRTNEIKDDHTHARLEAIPMNDDQGGRVCRDKLCPECDAPVISRMVEVDVEWDRNPLGPGYECTSCEHSWRI